MAWRPLVFGSTDGNLDTPPLVISTAFGSDSYSIQISDLVNIWSETLDRDSIIQRSEEESTSIDPSDGDQMDIFLKKLELGLQGTRDPSTELKLTTPKNFNSEHHDIHLIIQVYLPKPLQPLNWRFYLSRAPQQLFTDRIILPMIRSDLTRKLEVSSLEERLEEKDHIIEKLMDKLESLGADFALIFPQAAGKSGRKLNRTTTEEKVKGIKKHIRGALGTPSLEATRKYSLRHIVDTSFGDDVANRVAGPDSESFDIGKYDKWWVKTRGRTWTLSASSNEAKKQGDKSTCSEKPNTNNLKKGYSQDSMDDFQVQATPPNLLGQEVPGLSQQPDEDATESEEESSVKNRSPRKLGSIGAKRGLPKVVLPSQTKQVSQGDSSTEEEEEALPTPIIDERLIDQGSTTEDDDSSSPPGAIAPKQPQHTHTTTSSISSPRKRKLGIVGRGPRQVGSPSPAPEPEPEPEPELEPDPEPDPDPEITAAAPATTAAIHPKPKPRLGQIGRQKQIPLSTASQTSPTTDPSPPASRGRPHDLKPEPIADPEDPDHKLALIPPLRETSLDRADRKREQLKHDLASKGAKNMKKKRKF